MNGSSLSLLNIMAMFADVRAINLTLAFLYALFPVRSSEAGMFVAKYKYTKGGAIEHVSACVAGIGLLNTYISYLVRVTE